jgi:hypothetical protein
VSFSNTKQRVLSWAGLAFIGLALSIFGWGTGYKVSLYYPPSSQAHLMPHAKLLSGNEQRSSEKLQNKHFKNPLDDGRAEMELALLLAVFLRSATLRHKPAPGQQEQIDGLGRHARRCASLNFFFALPPPVLA